MTNAVVLAELRLEHSGRIIQKKPSHELCEGF